MNQPVAVPSARQMRTRADKWNLGLRLSIANAAFFFLASLILFSVEIRDVTYPTIFETVYAIGSLICFFVLLRNGGELAAMTFFVLAAGFYFGLGTMYSTVIVANWFQMIFGPDDQWRLLNKINLLNSFSVLIVLSAAWPWSRKAPSVAASVDGIAQVATLVSPLRRPLLFLSVPITLIFFASSFPEPENPAWHTVFLLMQAVANSAILFCGMQWSKLPLADRSLAIGLVIALSFLGLLILSKLGTLLPVAALLAGLMLDSRSSGRLIVGSATALIIAFLVLAILVNGSRGSFAYRPDNTFGERVAIVSNTVSLATTAVSSSAQGSSDTLQIAFGVLNRFGDAPIQAFLINRYDSGNPGDSLNDGWLVLVPRVLWSDKPDFSHQGLELEAQMTQTRTQTWLGPTFSGEAYWNGGWFYVILVSAMIGLEVGWFTQKWNKFRDEGLQDVGALIFAVPILANLALLESWVVVTYIGVAAVLAILVKVGDILGPLLVRFVSGPSPSQAPTVVT